MEKLSKIALVIISFVLFFLCYDYITDKSFQYRLIALIPIVFSLLMLIFSQKIKLNGAGEMTIFIVCIFRYIVSPLVFLSKREICEFATAYNYMDNAVFYMLFEMICIVVLLVFYRPRENVSVKNYNLSKHFTFFLVIVALGIFATNRNVTGNFNLLSEDNLGANDFERESNVVILIWQATLTYIYAIAIFSIYKSKKIRHRIVYSILLCAIYTIIIFTGQSSISRWYTVVTISASIAVFFKLYPNYRKSIAISLVVPGVVLIVAATIIKNTTIGYGAGFDTTMESIFDVNLMDIYFAGPVSVNSGIGASERFDIGLSSMFYDILNNFPILGNYIDRENASVALFGKYNGRGDLIIPLVVQSCCWFGKLGMGILSALSVIFVKKADLKFKYSISPISYVFAFVSIWTGIITILNFTIWISWFYSMIIPTYILFYVSKRIKI